jgi:hypothetical protein
LGACIAFAILVVEMLVVEVAEKFTIDKSLSPLVSLGFNAETVDYPDSGKIVESIAWQKRGDAF